MGFPGGFIGKESAWQRRRCKRHGFHPSGWEVPLKKEMEPHSSILAWRISRTEEQGRLYSMGLHRVGHN